MANEQLKRLFRRGPEITEADLEMLQSRVQARLRASGERVSPDEDGSGDPGGSVAMAVAADGSTGSDGGGPAEADVRIDAPPARARYLPVRATTYELPDDAIGVMADPKGSIWGPSDAPLNGEPGPSIDGFVGPRSAAAPTVKAPKPTAPKANATPAGRGQKRAAPTPRLAARPSAVRPAGLPYCPYCAAPLDPAPQTDRRCPRCRERIIVKRVDGRAVYLSEASVAVFEAERLRLVHAARWDRERQRWLAAAGTLDAPADRLRRLAAAPISEAVVEASRALYAATVERAFRLAQRERRWEDASRTMRDHALVLFRMAGSPVPPPEEILKPHRAGATAVLRGLGGMARDAEILGAKCCDACRADDGRIFPILAELQTPRLPHPGCPQGLCACDWYLALRDESLVRRHLGRRKRAGTGPQRV